jgi:FkbM family methyltransferase
VDSPRRAYGILKNVWDWFWKDVRHLGSGWAWFFLRELVLNRLHRGTKQPKPVRELRLAGYAHPIFYRSRSSDPKVIRHVLLYEEYAACADLPNVRLVLDCGANIGCAALYFLNRFADARIVVVEPDEANLQLCRRNLEPYGDRVRYYHAAVWSSATPLRIERGPRGEIDEWALRVAPAENGRDADVQGVDLMTLIREAGCDRIDLLKIDIEGAEAELFGHGAEAWLGRTDNLVVELHGAESERAFESAMRSYSFTRVDAGEYILCKGIAPAVTTPVP